MALVLYLVVVDASGKQLTGNGTPSGLTNPFRGNAAVTAPVQASEGELAGTLALSTSGGGSGAGKVDLGTLDVTLPDDSITPTLFRLLASGTQFRTVDLLAVSTGSIPKVVSGYGMGGSVFVTGFDRTVTSDGVSTKVSFDATLFSVGSAARLGGVYQPFTFVTYDATRNIVS